MTGKKGGGRQGGKYGEMEIGAKREVKTERGQGERNRGKDRGTGVGTKRGGTEGDRRRDGMG